MARVVSIPTFCGVNSGVENRIRGSGSGSGSGGLELEPFLATLTGLGRVLDGISIEGDIVFHVKRQNITKTCSSKMGSDADHENCM